MKISEMVKSLPKTKSDNIPAGWKTVDEVASETGLSECETGNRLRDLVAIGRVERRKFRRVGGVRPVYHYKEK